MHYIWGILLFIISLFFLLATIAMFRQKRRTSTKVISTIVTILIFSWGANVIDPSSSTSTTSSAPVTSNKTNGTTSTTPTASTPVNETNTTATSNITKTNKTPPQISNGVGLGDTVNWVQSHIGKPAHESTTLGEINASYDNSMAITYASHRVQYFEKDYATDVPLSTGKIDAKKMMPKDAVYTGRKYTYNKGGARELIYVYKSKSISKLWPASAFANANGVNQPGVFDVAYEYDTANEPNKLMAVIVFASDNP